MISEIENDYENIVKSFESHLTPEEHYRFEKISENELLKMLRAVMRFQRRIEESLVSVERIASETAYAKRLGAFSEGVLYKLCARALEKSQVSPMTS
jgi:hypothetical protein